MRTPMLLTILLTCATCTSGHNGTGQQPSATSASAMNPANPDTKRLFYGDDALRARLKTALANKGASYVPRTKHKDDQGAPLYTNRLILESSPYLQQHAHNPVNWFPWGDEAFRVARLLQRPIFLSVGYATCHWCHVMEEESFEDNEIAKYLNDNYVCIKVDREERPDVDAIYMRSVQLLTGRGGWPMSVWLTHDRKPFYGGTYFPARDGDRGARKGFLTLMREQREHFRQNPAGIADDAERLAARIKADMQPPAGSGIPSPAVIITAAKMARRRYDPVNGGPRGAPKFPSSFPIRSLLRYGRRTGDTHSLDMALTTLRKMQAGGMYDHAGGGFHRYSVDARWQVPHFEKMLYDNALLAMAYIEGYQQSHDHELARVARETLDYVVREMTAPGGGYYSATDADSLNLKGHREEGYYFTWTPAEIDALLGHDANTIKTYYDVTARGNFEGRNILHTPASRADVAKQLSLSEAELSATIDRALPLLRAARNKRPKPLLDNKIQVAWNGLMLSAMAKGAMTFNEARYRANAELTANFVLTKLRVKGRLRHSYKDGATTSLAFAEDYAFFIAGLIDLFELTHQARWLKEAIALSLQLEQYHENKSGGGYFRSASDHEKLLTREMETRDGAIPSAGSIALMNHLRLLSLTTDDAWRKRAERTMRAYASILQQRPWALDEMMLALDYYSDASKEVLIVVPAAADPAAAAPLLNVLHNTFLPNHVAVSGSAKQLSRTLGKWVPWVKDKPARGDLPTAYVCEQGACDLPTTKADTFRQQLLDTTPYPGPTAP